MSGLSASTTNTAIDLVDTAEAFAALRGWDDLVVSADRPSPFMMHQWLLEWWRYHADLGDLRVLAAHDERGGLLAAMPLFVRRSRLVRTLEFLGGDQSALADVLLAPEAPRDLGAAMMHRMAGIDADFARLYGFPGGSVIAAGASELRLSVIRRVESPILDMPEGWDAVYRAMTTSKKRNDHARSRRQLGELGEVRVEVARTEEELVRALPECFALHELRWQGRPDGSGFATKRGRAFHQAATRRVAAKDVARIVTLRVGGRAVAFHYFFLLGGTMYSHRLAFDPAYAKYSPGRVCTLDAIEIASGEGARRVEYLGGDDRYKLEFADRTAPLNEAIGMAKSPAGWVATSATAGTVKSRKRLKRNRFLRHLYYDGLRPVRIAAGRAREQVRRRA